jgi:hypothetical protein
VFSVCFGIGNLLLGSAGIGLGLLATAFALMALIVRVWRP